MSMCECPFELLHEHGTNITPPHRWAF